jgi:hypothetical protein
MIGAVAGFLLPVVAVWLAIVALRLHSGIRSRAVVAAVAVCIGLGVSSLTTTWFLALGMVIGPVFVAVDALLWTSIGVLAWWYLRRLPPTGEAQSIGTPAEPARGLTTTDWLVRGLFGIVAVLAVVSAVAAYTAAPHGEWDAWAVWNQKARFLFRGESGWPALLANDWSNPGHPLLVPTIVARLWAYAGSELTIVPAIVGMVFGAAIVTAVVGALDASRARAWIAGSVLLAAGTFVQQVASQQADVPFACFFVSTLIVLREATIAIGRKEGDAVGALLLSGMLAGLAAWTKNEGLLVVVAIAALVGWFALLQARPGRAGWWMVGVAPALVTLAWFKVVMAPVAPGYLAEAPTMALLLERFFGPERHAVVDPLLWQHLRAWGGPLAVGVVPLGLVVAVLVAVTRIGRSTRSILAVIGAMFAGYYGIYLLTSMDIEWLVMTTFDRLLVQIWPALVLAVFLIDDEPALVDATAAVATETAM